MALPPSAKCISAVLLTSHAGACTSASHALEVLVKVKPQLHALSPVSAPTEPLSQNSPRGELGDGRAGSTREKGSWLLGPPAPWGAGNHGKWGEACVDSGRFRAPSPPAQYGVRSVALRSEPETRPWA